MNQSDRKGRRSQTTQLSAPLLLTKSLYSTESLPTIATLDASSSQYPARSSIPSIHIPASFVEDELQSESEGQQTKQESCEGGTTSDFVKKLYRWVSVLQPEICSV